MRYLIWMPIAFAAAGGPLSTRADDLFLDNGGRIEAQLLEAADTTGRLYVLETESGARLKVKRDQVERLVKKSETERRYRQRLFTMPDTEEAHLEMAERCRKAGLQDRRLFHFEQVMRHNPEHSEARHALGYSLVDGKWIQQDEWLAQQGYQRYRGGWRLPQEIALLEAEEAREAAVNEWRRKLKNWRSWIVKGRDRSNEGAAAMLSVRAPEAAPALVAMLGNKKETRELRLMYVQILGELPAGEAVGALAKHSVFDSDARVREACLEQLERLKPTALTANFVKLLHHADNNTVLRAALALNRLKDPSATLPLINALVTEHKHVVSRGGGGLQPVFSNQGGGFSAGGKKEVKKIMHQNEQVLHALTALHPGVNFFYNQDAWKKWYIATKAPPPAHLRRGG